MDSTSRFDNIDQAPPIEVFAMIADFKKDTHKDKVNVSVGAYRTEEGKPWVLPVVRTVEAQMAADNTLNHEYLPVAGLEDFRTAACHLVLGDNEVDYSRVGGVQAVGGTGAIRLCADFTKKHLGCDTVYVSNPTWGNHKGVFKAAGFSKIVEYRYWKADSCSLDFDGMMEDLNGAPPKSVVILHAVAHNPTGVDPSEEQWNKIAQVCKDKNMFVLMDCAYQGFATGDLDADAFSCRMFYKLGFEYFIAQSFSKNFGLYNERVGNLCVVAKDSDKKTKVLSQLELIVRTTYSNPGNHGARIVATVLNNPSLCSEWKGNVKTMANRIKQMRDLLYQKLKATGCPGNWDHIISQIGMFSYTGLNEQQCAQMKKKYHIYIMKSGRINMCGLTNSNMDYVANAITDILKASEGQKQAKI